MFQKPHRILRSSVVGALALFCAAVPNAPFTYGRSLWEFAAAPSSAEVQVTATVLGPTPEEMRAFLAAQPKPPVHKPPLTAPDPRSDLSLLILGEAVLVAAFFYTARHGIPQFSLSTPAHKA